MKYLNRQRQQRLNFLKKGIGSKELPPLNFSGLLLSARDNYEAIMVASSVSADPIVNEVSAAIDYCNWRIEDTLYNDNTSAYQLQAFSSQPVNYFNEDSENGYYRRKYYFLKYYLQYSDALMSNWSGVSGFSGFDVSGLSGLAGFDLYDDVQLSAYQVASVKTFIDSLNQEEANDFNLLDKDSEKKVEDVKAIVGNKLPAKDEQTNRYKTEVDTLEEFEREYKQFIESLKQQKLSATSAEL